MTELNPPQAARFEPLADRRVSRGLKGEVRSLVLHLGQAISQVEIFSLLFGLCPIFREHRDHHQGHHQGHHQDRVFRCSHVVF